MKCIRSCDICKKAIEKFKDYRSISLISRVDWDCVVNSLWEYDLCQKCSLDIEKEIRRKGKLLGSLRQGLKNE